MSRSPLSALRLSMRIKVAWQSPVIMILTKICLQYGRTMCRVCLAQGTWCSYLTHRWFCSNCLDHSHIEKHISTAAGGSWILLNDEKSQSNIPIIQGRAIDYLQGISYRVLTRVDDSGLTHYSLAPVNSAYSKDLPLASTIFEVVQKVICFFM